MRKCIVFVAFLAATVMAFQAVQAQDITNKLGGHTGEDTFTVQDDQSTVLLTVKGDGTTVVHDTLAFGDSTTQETAAPAWNMTGLRAIAGAVDGYELTSSGPGYTVTANGAGLYAVAFTTPFSAPPVVTATPFCRELPEGIIGLRANLIVVTESAFSLYTMWRDQYDSIVATDWHFIAIGPK